MHRYVAFLRGMNLGRRRIRNEELCAAVSDLGFQDPTAFLASGNVVFDSPSGDPAAVAARLEEGLEEALGYAVPVFLRTAAEVREVARASLFEAEAARSRGKLQAAFLRDEPSARARREALALATDDDRLAFQGRQLFWLPAGGFLESALDHSRLETLLGPMTIRTKNTVQRLAKKFLSD